MADNGEARQAFAKLLNEASAERVLLVRGAPPTPAGSEGRPSRAATS